MNVRGGGDSSQTLGTTEFNRAAANDPEAWEKLYRIYGPLVRRWARLRSRLDEDAAEDVVNRVMAIAWRRVTGSEGFDRTRVPHGFRNWLSATTRHVALQEYRAANPIHGALPGEAVPATDRGASRLAPRPLFEQGSHLLDNIPGQHDSDHDSTVEDQADDRRQLLRNVLEEARRQTSATVWEAFERTVIGSEPVGEVASALGISASSVRVYRMRVKQRIEAMAAMFDA